MIADIEWVPPLRHGDIPDGKTPVWDGVSWSFNDHQPKPTPIIAPAPTLDEVKLSKWNAIKSLRDNLTLNGGCKVGTNWFLSTERARGEYTAMGLVSAGAPDTYVIMPAWRTMQAGITIDMTTLLVKQILAAGLTQAGAIDRVAQSHRAAMEASADPVNYDFSAGWPVTYSAGA